MQIVQSGNVSFHVRDEGSRDDRAVIFANSLGTDLRVWETLLPLLPAGLRIVRYDKRGHGLSDSTPAPFDMDLLVSDAETICRELALKDVTFVGLSIGGMIGQGLAAKRPDLVRALVLMDTAAKIGTADIWRARIDGVRENGIASLAEPILERWFTAKFRASNPQLALWRNMLQRTTIDGYAGCCAAIAAADLTDATRALTLPVLAVAGDQDGSTPPNLVQATAELCGAQFHMISDAGHLPCVEQPKATARLLSDFLERTA